MKLTGEWNGSRIAVRIGRFRIVRNSADRRECARATFARVPTPQSQWESSRAKLFPIGPLASLALTILS